MTGVTVTQEFAVPAQMVWNTIGSFNALPDWHPAIEKSELEEDGGSTIRRLSLVGGGAIVERLDQIDDNERLYSYSILEGPLPVANYTSTIRVRATAAGCTVEWTSEFEPSGASENDAAAAVRGIYESGFENLKRMMGG